MADTKKTNDSNSNKPSQEHYTDFSEAALNKQRIWEVSNTLPAPTNPHKNSDSGNKKGQ